MWVDSDTVGNTCRVVAEQPNLTKCYFIAGHDDDEPNTLYLWCYRDGHAVLGYGSRPQARRVARVLATHGMNTNVESSESFEIDYGQPIKRDRSHLRLVN
jgi:hypothetical protein